MAQENQPRIIKAVSTAPVSKVDETLQECFARDVANQSARLDELAKQLITLAIAIPGLYAAILKLVSGNTSLADNQRLLFFAFLCWFLALALSLASLLPGRYAIDPESLTEIQHYFSSSARRKLCLLTLACICSLGGICLAVLSIFGTLPWPVPAGNP